MPRVYNTRSPAPSFQPHSRRPCRLPLPHMFLRDSLSPGGYDASSLRPSICWPRTLKADAPPREAPPTVSRCNFVFFSLPSPPLPPFWFHVVQVLSLCRVHRTRLISWLRCIWRPPAAAEDETSFFMKLYNRFCYFIALSPHPLSALAALPSLPPSHPSRGPAVASRDSQGP